MLSPRFLLFHFNLTRMIVLISIRFVRILVAFYLAEFEYISAYSSPRKISNRNNCKIDMAAAATYVNAAALRTFLAPPISSVRK